MKSVKFWQVLIGSIVIGILCHMVFGWSMWATALLIVFVWFSENFSRWLYVPAIIILFLGFITTQMPMTASKSKFASMLTDLFVSKTVDSVQVKADVILEAIKNQKKDALLVEYTTLLNQGKVEEAKALLKAIDELYYPEKKSPPAVVIKDTVFVRPYPLDSVFTTGTYYINVKGETPYNIVIAPSRDGCARYGLMSEKYNYKIKFSDGEIVQGNPSIGLRHREIPKFKLFSEQGDRVKLIVM